MTVDRPLHVLHTVGRLASGALAQLACEMLKNPYCIQQTKNLFCLFRRISIGLFS